MSYQQLQQLQKRLELNDKTFINTLGISNEAFDSIRNGKTQVPEKVLSIVKEINQEMDNREDWSSEDFKNAQNQLNLTDSEMAAKCGVSPSTWKRIKAGKTQNSGVRKTVRLMLHAKQTNDSDLMSLIVRL